MSWCWRRSQRGAELPIKETHSLNKSMFASDTVIARLWLTFSHGIISTIACSLSLSFFLWKMAVCMTFFSLYWLITHLVAYNVSISGTALRLVLCRVVPERILSFSEAPPSAQCSHNSFQKKTLREQRKDACQAAQGTGPSDEKLWYLNALGRFLIRHFHLGIRVTKQHGQNSDSE